MMDAQELRERFDELHTKGCEQFGAD